MSLIINPFSLYYLCHHFYGTEGKRQGIPIIKFKNDLLRNKNLDTIKDFDVIHCEVNFFRQFCNEVLHKITTKFILTTGQWHLPQIHRDELTDRVIMHPNLILWISQNPIYENCEKYMSFPYGINKDSLTTYANHLISPRRKNNRSLLLPLARTNKCRERFPELPVIPLDEYYENLSRMKFVISPIGDRDDCYRHYESIGLGTIPISNVSTLYKSIFKDSMKYSDIEDMVSIDEQTLEYSPPNKDLICFSYYREIIQEKIRHS